MSKFNYKLALLGCLTSCLATVVYAEDGVIIIPPGSGIQDVACGSEILYLAYGLYNEGDDRVQIGDMFIEIESDDSFSDNPDLVEVIDPEFYWQCGFGADYYLYPDQVCEIIVQIDPSTLDCDGDTLPETGTIDRELEVQLFNYQREVEAPIDTEVTYLGAAADYTIVAEDVCTAEDDYTERCTTDPDAINSSLETLATINGHVAITDAQGFFSPKIAMSCSDCLVTPTPACATYCVDVDTLETERAEADVLGAFNGFLALASGDEDDRACNTIANPYLTEDGPFTFTAGIYCIDGQMPVTIDDTVTFNHGNGTLVIIISPEMAVDYVLQITQPDHLRLANGANPENIYWIVDGNTEIDIIPVTPEPRLAGNYAMIGNFLTSGYFELDHDDAMSPDSVHILGRILTIETDVVINNTSTVTGFTGTTTTSVLHD